MFESVLQVLAYTGVGLVVLVIGFVVLDLLTPGKLGQHGDGGQPGRRPARRPRRSLSLGPDPVLRDLLHRRRLGRARRRRRLRHRRRRRCRPSGFFILDLLIPGKLAEHCFEPEDAPGRVGDGRDSDLGRAGHLRVTDLGSPGSGASSPRSIAWTSSTTLSLARRGDAELAALARDAAVDDVDLGRAAGLEVLQHRGLHVGRVLHVGGRAPPRRSRAGRGRGSCRAPGPARRRPRGPRSTARRSPDGARTRARSAGRRSRDSPVNVLLTSSFVQIIPRTLSVTRASRPIGCRAAASALRDRSGAVELAEHVTAFGVADQVAGAGVGAAPLDQAGEQVAGADDRLDPVLDQAVAERARRRRSRRAARAAGSRRGETAP